MFARKVQSLIVSSALLVMAASLSQASPTLVLDDPSIAGIDLTVNNGTNLVTYAAAPTANFEIQSSTGTRTGPDDRFGLTLINTSITSLAAGDLVVAVVDSFSSAVLTASKITYNVTPSQNDGLVRFLLQSTTAAVGAPGNTSTSGGIFGTTLDDSGFYAGTAPFSGTVIAPVSAYSVALVAVIRATAAGQTFTFDFVTNGVPEPGFYGLLALALSGLFFFGFRRRHANTEQAPQ